MSGDSVRLPKKKPWWSEAVIYEVYIRSFADGNGDGIGDIGGLRSRLGYLRDLGVDAIWITPWYLSPMNDAGYDVSDHRAIDPMFGDLDEAESLIREAHLKGLRVIIDLVPNHSSNRHPWFRDAIDAGPGSPERSRYWFRPGRGPIGELPPNNWISRFGGSAWTRARQYSDSDTEWYLHLFTPQQPDFNWNNAEVRVEFIKTLTFWFDRGADGFRIDVAHGIIKDPELPDLTDPDKHGKTTIPAGEHPYWDRDEVQDVLRDWRKVADRYEGERTFVAEAWLSHPQRLSRYISNDTLQTAFNFDFLECPWNAKSLRDVIDSTLEIHANTDAPPTWVMSNHDVVRHVTRFGRAKSGLEDAWQQYGAPSDVELGTRRARAALLLNLALPGSVYLYQGEELGLWEVEDIPEHALQDPARFHSGLIRDGCRVPIPWSGDQPPFGFTDWRVFPWLPQPAAWVQYTVETQNSEPSSMLNLYRSALSLRGKLTASAGTRITWRESPNDTLVFDRSADWRCLVNIGGAAISYAGELLLASGPVDGRNVPPDTAIWIRPGNT